VRGEKIFTTNRILDEVVEMKKEKRLFSKQQIQYQIHLEACRERIRDVSPRIYEIIMIKTTKEVQK